MPIYGNYTSIFNMGNQRQAYYNDTIINSYVDEAIRRNGIVCLWHKRPVSIN